MHDGFGGCQLEDRKWPNAILAADPGLQGSGQACIAHRVRTSVRSSDALPRKLDMGFAWAAHLAQVPVDDRGDGPRELDWHCLPYHAVLLAR